jgi:DNA topoisomerase-1
MQMLDLDLTPEWVKEFQAYKLEETTQKITKKFEKDNEKRVADGEKALKASELTERLSAVKDLEKKYNKENKTGKVEAEGRGPTVEKIEGSIKKMEQRVDAMLLQAQDKEDNKEVALGTSKIVSIELLLNENTVCLANLRFERTTSTLVSLLYSARSSTCPLRSSSPRLFVRSSNGPSNPLRRTGSSKLPHLRSGLPSSPDCTYNIIFFASSTPGQWIGRFSSFNLFVFSFMDFFLKHDARFSPRLDAFPPRW